MKTDSLHIVDSNDYTAVISPNYLHDLNYFPSTSLYLIAFHILETLPHYMPRPRRRKKRRPVVQPVNHRKSKTTSDPFPMRHRCYFQTQQQLSTTNSLLHNFENFATRLNFFTKDWKIFFSSTHYQWMKFLLFYRFVIAFSCSFPPVPRSSDEL